MKVNDYIYHDTDSAREISPTEEFIRALSSVNREGIDDLLKWLSCSDFYTAPASTRFHGNYEGGLLKHSLNVYKRLLKKLTVHYDEVKVTIETLAIVALLHDICKANFYTVDYKNAKVYKPEGTKTDAKGNYEWESVPYYTINDIFPYGHGEKSVYIIQNFIRLSDEEAMAIRWHMGFSEPKENWNTLGKAIEKYPLILFLHEADMEATYIDENEVK